MTKKRKRTRTKKTEQPLISPMIIGIIVVASLLVVGGLVLLGTQSEVSVKPVDIDQFPTKGDPNAPVTIVEYSDFGCPHCQDFVLNKVDRLDEEYVKTGKVKYVVHPFHLGRPEIALATQAAWCADDQDRYFDYQHILFENQGITLNRTTLNDLAGRLELNRDEFSQCLSSGIHEAEVENARRAAVNLGINSTPTFFVNNRRVEGNQPYEQFQSIIEAELLTAQ